MRLRNQLTSADHVYQRLTQLKALLQSQPLTVQQIAKRMGVTTRRAYRDINRLRLIGYPIKNNRALYWAEPDLSDIKPAPQVIPAL